MRPLIVNLDSGALTARPATGLSKGILSDALLGASSASGGLEDFDERRRENIAEQYVTKTLGRALQSSVVSSVP